MLNARAIADRSPFFLAESNQKQFLQTPFAVWVPLTDRVVFVFVSVPVFVCVVVSVAVVADVVVLVYE